MPDRPHLVIPPYVGEFGWELMNWQAHVRNVVRTHQRHRITLAIAAGHEPLYSDSLALPQVNARSIRLESIPGRPSEDHRIDDDGKRIAPDDLRASIGAALANAAIETADAGVLWPDFRGGLMPTRAPHQAFVQFGQPSRPSIDVLLIPRARTSASERNHSPEWWIDLAARLRRTGLSIEHYAPPLANAIAQLRSARLAAGGSTGGLHLASLCGCPHVVWGPGKAERWTSIRMTNRQRYETIWNPLGTPVQYLELGWLPSIDNAASAILYGLKSIAAGTGAPAAVHKLRWRARRHLAGVWARSAAEGRMPWRMRELIRQATS